jgi:signal recognition particle subunit SRP54
MFDQLSRRLTDVFRRLRGEGHLTEANMREGMREIRLALLEADVHLQVAKDLLQRVQEKAEGREVLRSLTPAQQLVQIVQEELTSLLGGEHTPLRTSPRPPTVILMAGLQGSGKTTTAAKLAAFLKQKGRSPLLVPADLARPAAVEQLVRLAENGGLAVWPRTPAGSPLQAAREGLTLARGRGHDPVLIDTAGRLHVDAALMAELREVRDEVHPTEILYVADAMTGQDAVTSASRFHAEMGLTGVVLTKLDGDARGGAAISIRAVTGVPIRFSGTGEKLADLEPFHPGRLASRILGMGDVLTLVEKAQAVADADEAADLAARLRKDSFTLEEFRDQIRKVRKLGPLDQLLRLLPGAGSLPMPDMDGKELVRAEAILNSMTGEERRNHALINGSRRKRIARGSGTEVSDVNRLLKQFVMITKLMKKTGGGLDPRALRKMRMT